MGNWKICKRELRVQAKEMILKIILMLRPSNHLHLPSTNTYWIKSSLSELDYCQKALLRNCYFTLLLPKYWTGQAKGEIIIPNHSCKKTPFVQYPGFQLENFQIMYLLNVAIIWTNACFLLNFIHVELKIVIDEQFCSRFCPTMVRLAATIWKCPEFLPEMSGILDTRIQPFCNSVG